MILIKRSYYSHKSKILILENIILKKEDIYPLFVNFSFKLVNFSFKISSFFFSSKLLNPSNFPFSSMITFGSISVQILYFAESSTNGVIFSE